MIRYGILSTASIVERFVKGIRASKDGYVQAIASRTIKSAKDHAQKLDIPFYYGSYEELIVDPNVDIIYIPTVNALHYRDCKLALNHGKHVIVEKPFCLKESEVIELFTLARQKNLFLMEAQKAVFLPTTKKIKTIIDSGQIGEVSYVELKAGFPKRFTYDHWMYDLSMGGGSLYGSATYTIEYMQYIFEDPKMKISGSHLPCPTGSDEVSHFELVLDQHIMVASTITMNVPLQNEAVFYGEKGYIVVPDYWKATSLELYLHDGNHQSFDFSCESEFVYEIEHIHECIKKGLIESPIMCQERTQKTVRLVESLYKKWQL